MLRSMLPYQCGINEFVNDGEHAVESDKESDKESEEESAEFNSNVLLVVLEMLEKLEQCRGEYLGEAALLRLLLRGSVVVGLFGIRIGDGDFNDGENMDSDLGE